MRLLSFIILLALISCSGGDSKIYVGNRYGLAFNPERQKAGLPLVTEEMELIEHEPLKHYAFVKQHQPTAKVPCYLRKMMMLNDDSGIVTHEGDYYYNPQLKFELDYEHEYDNGETIIMLQDLQKDSMDRSMGLNFLQADSVLRSGD